jgi:hypothetical protein
MLAEGWAWSSSDQTTWERSVNRLPFGIRSGTAFVYFDNKLWAYGGVMGTAAKNDIWFTADGVRWTNVATRAAWSARRDHRVIEFMGKLWLIGGNDGYERNDIWFSNNGVDWRSAGPAPAWLPRSRPIITVFNDRLWMYGGGGGPVPRIDVWASENGRDWTEIAARAAWPGRACAGGGAFDGRLWYLGGATREGTPLKDVWSSADGATWVRSPDPDWSRAAPIRALCSTGGCGSSADASPSRAVKGGSQTTSGFLIRRANGIPTRDGLRLLPHGPALPVERGRAGRLQRGQVRRRLFPLAGTGAAPQA